MKDATFKIHGRLGGDVEFRENNGKRMAIINVATEERYIKDNEEVKKTHWLRLICFKGNLMNYLGYFRKGMLADFEGLIKTSEWNDSNGTKQYGMNLEVDDARLIGFIERRENQQNQNNDQNQGYNQPQNQGQQNQPQNRSQQNQPQNQGQPNQNSNDNAHAQAGNGYGGQRG